jgi:hypothetical protein
MDKQITYLWLVELNLPGSNTKKDNNFVFAFDDEVAETRWMTRQQVQSWLNTEPNKFCDDTIQALLQLVLDRLKYFPQEENYSS